MNSNFQFLNNEILTSKYYARAADTEQSYCIGQYASAETSARVVAENIARDVVDQLFIKYDEKSSFAEILSILKTNPLAINDSRISKDVINLFYKLKQPGNVAAHTLTNGKRVEALDTIKNLYVLCVWFVNAFFDEKVDPTKFKEPNKQDFLYVTTVQQPSVAENTSIYIQTVDKSKGNFPEYNGQQKIGKTTVPDLAEDNTDNSSFLRSVAQKRVNEYMTTAGLPSILEWTELAYRKSDGWWFTDHDVHKVLENSHIPHSPHLDGKEWFQTDLETAKRAIKAVKDGKTALDELPDQAASTKINLRPEQQTAVEKTIQGFKTGKKFLWNAKMRFGKTLTALELVKEKKYQKVLIMTHRPVVDEGWFQDFRKIGMPQAGYVYGTKKLSPEARKLGGHDSVAELEKLGKPYIFFASIQDLGGSELAGGKVSDKNRDIFAVNWDLIIVDEAHEGTQTELTQNILKLVLKKKTKELDLSGTPFNILSDYDPDHVYTWDYTMEQTAKADWSKNNPGKNNPYAGLPKVLMFTFEMTDHFKDPRFTGEGLGQYQFNFKEFFRVNRDGKFVYEQDVKHFLDNITNPGPTNYPFSTRQFRNSLRHTLWIMPGIKEANALEELLKQHPVFGKEYRILNVVRHDTNADEEGTDNDAERENKDIRQADKDGLKTITLTVRKLTTGATIPEWTGVLFLSNTNSAMQYLQAAFRAQTPYSSPEFGKKENCYIFDFAPDRALTVMAEATSLSTGVGKLPQTKQRQRMAKLMNFLPIIGEQGQEMKPYKVDSLLSKIKRAYAEKAVRTGFDDDSIYSDALMLVDEKELKLFNDLKANIGTTKREKAKLEVDVNNQGLTGDEYDKAERAKNKPRKERTPEEQADIDKENATKKKRRALISVLRGVSIRIPMMIYGMDIKFDEDVSIEKFVNNIDDVSWQEFMPKKVTKELFKQLIKYYDADVFIEAGKIIRRRVKELDKSDPLERVDKIADIFSTFRNPDKETVLTPWRVVNMHLGKTIGGLSFFDKDYQSSYKDGKLIRRWINTEYTDQTLSRNSHVLEINSKTGLYPLYIVTSIYWREFQKLNDQTAGKFNFEDEQLLWKTVLRENIFLVAKTPMAREIAKRTLAGYHNDWQVNVKYVENIVEDSKENAKTEAEKIEGLFDNMKFDVVIGNPPYQESMKNTSDNAIYNEFMDLSFELSNLVTLITPARFLFNAGKTPKNWNKKMLNDKHLKVIKFFRNSGEVFPNTDIKGGVVITLRDANQEFGAIKLFIPQKIAGIILEKVRKESKIGLSQIGFGQNSFKFTKRLYFENPDLVGIQSKGHKYDLKSNVLVKMNKVFFDDIPKDGHSYTKIIGRINNSRVEKFIRTDYVFNNTNLNGFKVVMPKANGTGAFGEIISGPFVAGPRIGFTETFISFGNFNNEEEADNLLKYIKTKFARMMLNIIKITQDNTVSKWKYVPMQDFTTRSDIDWSKSISEIDQQLYKKYSLSQKEVNFIESRVSEMK